MHSRPVETSLISATFPSKIRRQHFVVRGKLQIFDNDGDGMLSYQEFIAMMKDRIHRGLKSYSRQEGWEGFKQCIKREMREAS